MEDDNNKPEKKVALVNPIDDVNETRKSQLLRLRSLSNDFGKALSETFAKGIAEGRRFDDVLKGLKQRLVEFGLRAALKPLELAASRGLETLLSGIIGPATPIGPDLSSVGKGFNLAGLGKLIGSANGNVFAAGAVRPFAGGGVVAAPTYFPMKGGLGLMGERGAEAIVPLARGADGKLGIRSGGGARPVTVTVNIATPDIEGFRRSEAQVAASLARAVSRGRRAM